MKTLKYLLFLLSFFILFACSNDKEAPKDGFFYNNIDQAIGWGVNHSTIIRGEAFSGNYLCKVDSLNPYSFGLELPLDSYDIPFHKVKASVYGKLPDLNTEILLVIQLFSNNDVAKWESTPFNKVIQSTSEWAKIEAEMTMPDNLAKNSVLKVYMWSPGKGVGYCDDFEVSFVNE